jgi:multicomponent Na+:H+ antiporter subunit D
VDSSDEPVRIKEAPLFCLIPLCVTAVGTIVLFFLADEIYDVLLPLGM